MKFQYFPSLNKLALLLTIVTLLACKKDEVEPEPTPPATEEPVSDNEYINDWIYAEMRQYYYWNESLPAKTGLNREPSVYFNSLMNEADRFSVIRPNFQELLNSLGGISRESGYEFALLRESAQSDNVVAQILYVKHNSPAADAGLRRGDIIFEINGTQMTLNNYRGLVNNMFEDHRLNYRRYDTAASAFVVNENEISLSAVELAENPNFMDSVYTVNGQKIGYYMYNFFALGEGNLGTEYDDQMEAIIANFKGEGITELIVDLRYNSGGRVSSALNLGSLIGKDVDESKIFYKNRYNAQLHNFFINDPRYGEDFLSTKFLNKPENIGGQLNKIIFLVSDRSASASELMINGLKPFMQVVLIGERTVGKNVGSIPIYEENDSRNDYGLLPIVFQSFNSLDESDYSNGFDPDVEHDELAHRFGQIGDIENESMLRTAIEYVTGQSTIARQSNRQEKDFANEKLSSSIERQFRFGRMVQYEQLPTMEIAEEEAY